MIPCPVRPIPVLFALLASLAGPAGADVGGVGTILRRANNGIEAAAGLGPRRQQGRQRIEERRAAGTP